MTVPLTPIIIILGLRAADSNACAGSALPLIGNTTVPALEINAIVEYTSRAPAVRKNKSPSARSRQAATNIDQCAAVSFKVRYYEVALTTVQRAPFSLRNLTEPSRFTERQFYLVTSVTRASAKV